MRLAVPLVLALLAAGCGRVRTANGQADGVPSSPVYAAPIAEVHAAAVRACESYFGEVDRSDEVAHVIENDNFAFWVGGRTVTTLRLREVATGRTEVDIESRGAFPAGFAALGPRERHIVRELISRMDRELKRAP